MMKKKEIRSYNYNELEQLFLSLGEKKFRSKQVYEWLHQKCVSSFEEMTNLSKELRETLSLNFDIQPLTMVDRLVSNEDGTNKFLFRLFDGKVVESVLMRYKHGNSVCISSQVGCKMGCKFCASTIGGLERNLTHQEMLSQIYEIQRITGERVSNVVVMGTGEPFDNFEALCRFLEMISDEHGLHISQRNITVSTCGLVPKIYELADKAYQITLAISLHAPTDEVRRLLIPIASKYSIEEIIKACHYYDQKTGRRLTFEYSMCEGINDKEEHARQLASLLKGINGHVNLINVNPIKERDFRHAKASNLQKFKLILEKNRINVTIRREMGSDINAACGQLRKSYMDTIS